MKLFRVINSHRTYLGVLLGIATWLAFGLLFGRLGVYTMTISLLVTMWVSNTYEPGKLARLGALIGFPAGLFYGVQMIVRQPAASSGGIVLVVVAYLLAGVSGLMFTIVCGFGGYLFGTIAQLYKRKAIF